MSSFLDLFNVVDSDGVSATRYRLYYLGSSLSHLDSLIFGMLTKLVYLFFQIMVVPANALLGAVLNSSSWINGLGDFYRKLTAPVFAVFPPWGIACLGLAAVAVSQLRANPTNIHGSETLNRVGGALAMTAMVLVLTYNPFALVAKLLELSNGFSVGLAAAVSGSGNDSVLTAGKELVDASIRTPTIALNYGGEMTASCRSQWSQSMLEGKALAESTGCFAPNANEAGPGTLGTAVLMLILPALPMLVFCGVAAWKYFTHLTYSVMWLLKSGWLAAFNVYGRRGFDKLVEAFAKCGSHLVMAVLTSMLAVALPATVAGLGTQLLSHITGPSAQAYALMVSLGVGFGVSAWAIVRLTSSHGVLVKVLKADLNPGLTSLLSEKKTEFKFTNLATWVGDGKEPEEKKTSGSSPSRGGNTATKKTELAADPAAATKSSSPQNTHAGGPRGGSDKDTSVDQLIVPAQSVADPPAGTASSAATAGDGYTGSAVILSSGAPLAAPATTEGTSLAGASVPIKVSFPDDPYAFYFDSFSRTDAAPGPDPATGGDDAASAVDTSASDAAESLNDPAQVAETAGDSSSGATGSALAEPVRSTAPETSTVAATPPVPGLLGADPAVEQVARTMGIPFVVYPKPSPRRRVTPMLRLFGRSLAAPDLSAGAVPEVEYGPPLAPVEHPPRVPATPLDRQPPAGDPDGPVNDQQRWNRGRQLFDIAAVRDATPDRPETEPAASGSRPHPGSFQAPLVDFLAGDAVACEIEVVRTVFGAGGTPVDIKIDPLDRRVGLQLSSDPDERLRSSNPPGFGDPT